MSQTQKLKLPKLRNESKSAGYNFSNLNTIVGDKKENLMIKEAVKNGYLVYASQELIWSKFKNQIDFNEKYKPRKPPKNKKPNPNDQEVAFEDLKLIEMLNMPNVRIVETGQINLCVNLKILNLSRNHLINIESLSACVNLLRLDLQNNQILQLPNKDFWSEMTQLKFLFLHGNPLGKLEIIKYLSGCTCLEVLTLYDTPVSLKYNYRHHAVNSILTLKALDEYVISDEEIIEEAEFNNIFKTKSQVFRIQLIVPPAENDSYKSELKATQKLLKKINRIISHYSPVHIFQKFIRGFLARKRYKLLKLEYRNKVAKKIQDWWRKMIQKRPIRKNLDIQLGPFKPSESEATYQLNPGKNTAKSSTRSPTNSTAYLDEHFKQTNSEYGNSKSDFKRETTDLDALSAMENRKRNIIIDLNKLSKIQSLFDQSDSKFSIESQLNLSKDLDPKETEHPRFISLSRFMSMIQENLSSEELSKFLTSLSNDPEMKDIIKMHNLRKQLEASEGEFTEFRLPRLVPRSLPLNGRDNFVIDLVREKHLGANAIKMMENDIHKKMNEMRQEIKQVNRDQFITNDQRFFQRAFGNMSLGCLRAVDKAYEDRSQVEKQATVQKKVDKLKAQNKYSRDRVDFYKEDYVKESHESHKLELQMMEKARIKSEQDMDDLKEKVQEEKQKRQDFAKNRRKDINMAIEFSKQHLSVSKALQKHEHVTSKEANKLANNEYVNKHKSNDEKQRELVRKYTSQRNILRLIQSTNDRLLIEKRIKEESEEQQFNARVRVDKLRQLEFRGYRQNHTGRSTRVGNSTNIINLLYELRPISYYNDHDIETVHSHDLATPLFVPENTNIN